MFKLMFFIAASIFFAYISRASLRVFRSHGFFRFLAWEAILALVLLNEGRWFDQPFTIRQIISWFLLLISVFLVVNGLSLLKLLGKPNDQRDDQTLFVFEKTTNLVTVGAFRYIRHPMYCSLLCLAWGAFLKDLSYISFTLVLTTSFFLLLTAKSEEIECMDFFGSCYKEYMGRTKRFIPFIF
jgi:protein-S-isoprenylcysteine O-methyltransferase Ste14